MPDQAGRLSPAEIEHIQTYVARQSGGVMPACPVSSHRTWLVVPHVGQNIIYPVSVSGAVYPDAPYPFVMMICTGCGYMMLLNATMLGLYPQVGEGNV